MNTINNITFMNDIGLVRFYNTMISTKQRLFCINRSKLGFHYIFLISRVSFAYVFYIHNVTFVFHDKWEM